MDTLTILSVALAFVAVAALAALPVSLHIVLRYARATVATRDGRPLALAEHEAELSAAATTRKLELDHTAKLNQQKIVGMKMAQRASSLLGVANGD